MTDMKMNGRDGAGLTSARQPVTIREAVAAARARVAADKKRGADTDKRIIALSERKVS